MLNPDPGSFKDPTSRVYHCEGRVLRGLNTRGAGIYEQLEKQAFFNEWLQAGKIIHTGRAPDGDDGAAALSGGGWAMALVHQRIPFVSYAYEWPFAMLKDAALLHLDLLAESIANGWILKDATPYNIQWLGARPVFIDIPSLQPRPADALWSGYRQFCMNFLFPLMLKAHLNINYLPLLRAELDGITAADVRRYFSGHHLFKKGVLPHVVFPAWAEAAAIKHEARAKNISPSRQSATIVLGLVRGLQNTVGRLSSPPARTVWSDYEKTHSYNDTDAAAKKDFVRRCAAGQRWRLAWDLGCNTGVYAAVCAEYADYVVATDGDHDAVENLYLAQRAQNNKNILPLIMNLANMSPGQGWAGKERAAFERRGSPDLVMCLALIHHLRITANIPLTLILDWLRELNAALIIEFVGRDDEMTQKLLHGKSETYDDYNQAAFEAAVTERFIIARTAKLKNGMRQLYFLLPQTAQ